MASNQKITKARTSILKMNFNHAMSKDAIHKRGKQFCLRFKKETFNTNEK